LAFGGIGVAPLPDRNPTGLFWKKWLGDGMTGDEDMLNVLNCLGGDERTKTSAEAMVRPTPQTLRSAQLVKKERDDRLVISAPALEGRCDKLVAGCSVCRGVLLTLPSVSIGVSSAHRETT
jgi:hypothetical protein